MNVNDLMTSPVHTCRTSARLGDAAQIMLQQRCGCVPIVDGRGRLAGMVTDRDVCLAVAARHRSPWEIPVRDVMSPDVVTCHVDDDVDAVLVAMKENRVRRVPIVDEERRVRGLISIDDVMRNTGLARGRLASEAAADVMRHICSYFDRASPETKGAAAGPAFSTRNAGAW